MNSDTLAGQGRNVGGQAKEVIGKAIGDEQLAASGLSDQALGIVQNAYGKLRDLARERPIVFTATLAVFGFALFQTLKAR